MASLRAGVTPFWGRSVAALPRNGGDLLQRPRLAAVAASSTWNTLGVRHMSSGWGMHGMYGGRDVDPTAGRAKWHKLDTPKWKEDERPVLGQINEKEYDEKHGRHWHNWKEKEERPKLYTTIGKHARSQKLSRTIVRWVKSGNFVALRRDVYRKRWPKKSTMRFFAEFCLKEHGKRTLLETCHTIPLYGVGCKFWRSKHRDLPESRGQYFVADSAQWKLRPIRGVVRGTQYLFNRPARSNIAPIAKSLGHWNYDLPEGAHPDVYRPAFPAPLSGVAAENAEE